MYGFVGARLLHTLAYATKQSREIRATLYTIGSVVVVVMAIYGLVAPPGLFNRADPFGCQQRTRRVSLDQAGGQSQVSRSINSIACLSVRPCA